MVHDQWCYRVTLVSARFPVLVSSTTSFKTLYIRAFGQDGAWQEAKDQSWRPTTLSRTNLADWACGCAMPAWPGMGTLVTNDEHQ